MSYLQRGPQDDHALILEDKAIRIHLMWRPPTLVWPGHWLLFDEEGHEHGCLHIEVQGAHTFLRLDLANGRLREAEVDWVRGHDPAAQIREAVVSFLALFNLALVDDEL